MIVDFHTHTKASDGILSPKELVSRANLHGVNFLAVTDHDTVEGLPEARQQAKQLGMRFLGGIEMSCQWRDQGIHIVGLGIDSDSSVIKQAVAHQATIRESRAHEISRRLEKVGFRGAYQGALEQAGGNNVGRPHFARFMVEKGFSKSVNEAFKKYLGAGRIGDVKQGWPSIEQGIEWIVGAGGTAVLAHPEKYKMTRSKICRLVESFVGCGGQALEVISGSQTPEITAKLAQIAQKYDLKASCGSDFHDPKQKWQELGSFGKLPAFCEPVWQNWD